jgi:hypothetical protein
MIIAPDHPIVPATDDPAPATRRRGGGPQTPEGRARSAKNSLKHGLRAKTLLPDDLAAAVARRNAELVAQFDPSTPYQSWLVYQLALAAARLDRCAEMMIVDLQYGIDRAGTCWDDDRRQAVEDLGARLPKDPARVARALRRVRQGADWLIERWEALGEIVEVNGRWSDDQRRLAFDLLGVPAELRDGSRRVPAADDAEGLAALVSQELAALYERRETTLEAKDRAELGMAAWGMPLEEDPQTARLRKYERACRRDLSWALAELRSVQAGSEPAGEPSVPEPELSHRRPVSAAAADYLAKRSRYVGLPSREAVAEVEAEAPAVPDEAPAVVEAMAEVAAPAPSVTTPAKSSMVPPSAPRNRRERRAAEKRARQAARRAGR